MPDYLDTVIPRQLVDLVGYLHRLKEKHTQQKHMPGGR